MRRVVITGVGAITGAGKTADELWENMKQGKNGISNLSEDIRKEVNVHVGGKISNYGANEYFDRKKQRTFDSVNQFAVIAAKEAAKNANLDSIENRYRIGTNITSGIGGISTIESEIETALNKGYRRVSPMFIPKAIINLVAGNVAIELNTKGITNSIVTACASSTDALGHAVSYIKSGMVDVMVTGGSEAALTKSGLAGFNSMKALTRSEDPKNASIPFDENRNGFVMGEGAAVLVVEELEHAKKRGANIIAEVVGYGSTCDASHITAPDSEAKAATVALEMALENANIVKSDVKLINAHGTSTPLNDKSEVNLFKKVFEEEASSINVTSTKSITGHLLGAAGAVEAINIAMSLKEGVVTPTINTTSIDPECEGVNIIRELTSHSSQYAMSTSLGFGGHNSAIILKKYEE